MTKVSKRLLEKQHGALSEEMGLLLDNMEDFIGNDEEFFRRGDAIKSRYDEMTEHLRGLRTGKAGNMETIFTLEEVATILKIPVKSARNFVREKKIKGFKIGREWRVAEVDLQAYIDRLKAERDEQA